VRPFAGAGICATALLLLCGRAEAFCRTTTCDHQGASAECVASRVGDCSMRGTPIYWPSTCVSTSVSAQGSVASHITADTMRAIVRNAFQQWTNADCGNGEKPNFVVDIFPDVNCTDLSAITQDGDAGYKPTGPNYNLWIFRDNDWPFDNVRDEGAIAVTTTQFDRITGEIFDSDVELNSLGNTFTTDPDAVDMDLRSVVQHESGHFLGLGHAQASANVMWRDLSAGVVRRVLQPDDIQGICTIYPPGKLNPQCDPEPRHGFSTECEFDKGCCAIAPGQSANHRRPWGAVGVSLLLLLSRRMRRS
jgi:hypothetical protein